MSKILKTIGLVSTLICAGGITVATVPDLRDKSADKIAESASPKYAEVVKSNQDQADKIYSLEEVIKSSPKVSKVSLNLGENFHFDNADIFVRGENGETWKLYFQDQKTSHDLYLAQGQKIEFKIASAVEDSDLLNRKNSTVHAVINGVRQSNNAVSVTADGTKNITISAIKFIEPLENKIVGSFMCDFRNDNSVAYMKFNQDNTVNYAYSDNIIQSTTYTIENNIAKCKIGENDYEFTYNASTGGLNMRLNSETIIDMSPCFDINLFGISGSADGKNFISVFSQHYGIDVKTYNTETSEQQQYSYYYDNGMLICRNAEIKTTFKINDNNTFTMYEDGVEIYTLSKENASLLNDKININLNEQYTTTYKNTYCSLELNSETQATFYNSQYDVSFVFEYVKDGNKISIKPDTAVKVNNQVVNVSFEFEFIINSQFNTAFRVVNFEEKANDFTFVNCENGLGVDSTIKVYNADGSVSKTYSNTNLRGVILPKGGKIVFEMTSNEDSLYTYSITSDTLKVTCENNTYTLEIKDDNLSLLSTFTVSETPFKNASSPLHSLTGKYKCEWDENFYIDFDLSENNCMNSSRSEDLFTIVGYNNTEIALRSATGEIIVINYDYNADLDTINFDGFDLTKSTTDK